MANNALQTAIRRITRLIRHLHRTPIEQHYAVPLRAHRRTTSAAPRTAFLIVSCRIGLVCTSTKPRACSMTNVTSLLTTQSGPTEKIHGDDMPTVNTVLGPIEGEALGSTLMHEHVFVLSPEIEKTSEEWDEEGARTLAVQRLHDLKASGIDTIVDLTVIGLGRKISRIAAVAEQVPEINIVAATGVYTYNDVPMFFHFRGPGTIFGGPEPMTELFVREIREGVGDTSVRAGILKCATDTPGMTPGVERVLRSVAQAHRATGVPITTHTPTPPQPWGLEQQRILADEGVDLSRVVIGHSGGTLDTTYHEALLANGSYLGFDHFGIATFSMAERIQSVKVLCDRGHADRIVLSHDAMCHVDWFPASMSDAWKEWRWTHIPQDVLPEMRRMGISDENIRTMMVDNPRRILEGGEPY